MLSFWDSGLNVLDKPKKIFGRVIDTAFDVSREIFLVKLFLRRFSLIFSLFWESVKMFPNSWAWFGCFLITIIRKFCQRCKLLVHRNVLQKRNCSVKFIFFYTIVGHWAKEKLILAEKTSAKLSKLLSSCPAEKLVKNIAKSTLLLLFFHSQ